MTGDRRRGEVVRHRRVPEKVRERKSREASIVGRCERQSAYGPVGKPFVGEDEGRNARRATKGERVIRGAGKLLKSICVERVGMVMAEHIVNYIVRAPSGTDERRRTSARCGVATLALRPHEYRAEETTPTQRPTPTPSR